MTDITLDAFIRGKTLTCTSWVYFRLAGIAARIAIMRIKTDRWVLTCEISASFSSTGRWLFLITASPILALSIVITPCSLQIACLSEIRWDETFRILTFSTLTLNILRAASIINFIETFTETEDTVATIFIKSAHSMIWGWVHFLTLIATLCTNTLFTVIPYRALRMATTEIRSSCVDRFAFIKVRVAKEPFFTNKRAIIITTILIQTREQFADIIRTILSVGVTWISRVTTGWVEGCGLTDIRSERDWLFTVEAWLAVLNSDFTGVAFCFKMAACTGWTVHLKCADEIVLALMRCNTMLTFI